MCIETRASDLNTENDVVLVEEVFENTETGVLVFISVADGAMAMSMI